MPESAHPRTGDRPGGPRPARLHTRTRRLGDRALVRLTGELDLDTRDELRRVLDAALAASRTGVDLDLTDVRFCDCAGLNTLLAARERARREGRTLTFTAVGPAARHVFDLTGTLAAFIPPPPGGDVTHVSSVA